MRQRSAHSAGGRGQRALLQGLLLIAALGAAILLGGLATDHPARATLVALLAITGLLILRRPVLGLGLAAFTDVTCSYISGLTIFPPRVYLAVLVGMLSLPRIPRALREQPWFRRILGLSIAFALLIALVDSTFGNLGFIRRGLARHAAPLLLFASICAQVRTQRDLRIILYFFLGGVAFSALIGILQYHQVGPAWDLRLALAKYYKVQHDLSPADLYTDPTNSRILGMAANPIDFSYHLVLGLGLLLPLVARGGLEKRQQLFAITLLALLIVATVESLTRSAILAAWIGILLTGARSFTGRQRSRRLRALLLLVAVTTTAAGAFASLGEDVRSSRVYSFEDVSRPTLALAGLMVAARHPFGVGTSRTPEVIRASFSDFAGLDNPTVLLHQTSHNYFLNLTAFYGWLAALLVFIFYRTLLRSGRALRSTTSDPRRRWLGEAALIHVATYSVHCSLHNAGPFFGDPAAWTPIALLVAGHALARRSTAPPT